MKIVVRLRSIKNRLKPNSKSTHAKGKCDGYICTSSTANKKQIFC